STLPEEQSVTLSVTDFFRELGIPTVRDGTSCEVLSKSTTEISDSDAAKEVYNLKLKNIFKKIFGSLIKKRNMTMLNVRPFMVENDLHVKPGGEDVLDEYKSENSLKHGTRRKLVNILVSHMTELHGLVFFFYDAQKGTGYLAWCLKTISRKKYQRPVKGLAQIIEEAKHLTRTNELFQLLKAAEKLAENDETSKHYIVYRYDSVHCIISVQSGK
uniref:Uncharacterized protein n=1 Tax=Oryzias latipes TaxID=8090 RepID=A0A3P9IU06_ORYLA